MLRAHGIQTFYRQLFGGLIQISTAIIISKTLEYKGLGVFAVSTLATVLFAQFFSFGIGASIAFHVASGRFSEKNSINATILYSLFVGPLSAIACAAFYYFFHDQLFPEISYTILFVSSIACPVLLLNELILGVLQGANRLNEFNSIALIQPSFLLVGIVPLSLFHSLDALALVIAWVLSGIIQAAYSLYTVLRVSPLNLSLAKCSQSYGYIKIVFPYAIRAHCSNLTTFLIYRLDVYLVDYLAGNAAAGIYFLAVRLTEQFWIFSHAASTVLLPKLTASYSKNHNTTNITPRAVRIVLIATTLGALCFCIGLWAVSYMTKINSFSFLMSNVIVLSIGSVAFSASRLLANDNASRGFVSLNIWSAIVILLVNTSLDFALVPILGPLGASLATVAAYISSLLLQISFQRYFYKVPLASYLPRQDDIVALKEICLMGIPPRPNLKLH